MENLVVAPGRRVKLGQAAASYVLSEYSWDAKARMGAESQWRQTLALCAGLTKHTALQRAIVAVHSIGTVTKYPKSDHDLSTR
jgi:hypothetical protein